MEFGLGSYGFGFLAGLLSTLSPCVLPIIPILLGSATHVHPRAPLALWTPPFFAASELQFWDCWV